MFAGWTRNSLAVRTREPWNSCPTTMPRYLWCLDPVGWPLERIDTLTGEHVPVLLGGADESLHTQGASRPIACRLPRVEGVSWHSC